MHLLLFRSTVNVNISLHCFLLFLFTCCTCRWQPAVPRISSERGTHPSTGPNSADPGSGCKVSYLRSCTGSVDVSAEPQHGQPQPTQEFGHFLVRLPTSSAGFPSVRAISIIQFSATIMPCGPPNPLKAVLDGMWVQHRKPRPRTFGTL